MDTNQHPNMIIHLTLPHSTFLVLSVRRLPNESNGSRHVIHAKSQVEFACDQVFTHFTREFRPSSHDHRDKPFPSLQQKDGGSV
jgi:hypothetical protein